MSVKLFVLGRPGSGKTTAFHHIDRSIDQQYQGWSAIRYHDYAILQEKFRYERLFQSNIEQRKFQAANYGGFDVLDFSVLDNALTELEAQVQGASSPKDDLIIIEFARDDYDKALKHFRSRFLQNAYFLFVDVDLETCIQRVKKRVNQPGSIDDHFVSEEIFRKYYSKQYVPQHLITKTGDRIDKWRIKTISNRGTKEAFLTEIDRFISKIIKKEIAFADESLPLVGSSTWRNLTNIRTRFAALTK
ncbi:MAG: hypothetical protein NVSMB33_12000 [Ktedonobacteraceae bacterium]